MICYIAVIIRTHDHFVLYFFHYVPFLSEKSHFYSLSTDHCTTTLFYYVPFYKYISIRNVNSCFFYISIFIKIKDLDLRYFPLTFLVSTIHNLSRLHIKVIAY